jgi:hypothetical protein
MKHTIEYEVDLGHLTLSALYSAVRDGIITDEEYYTELTLREMLHQNDVEINLDLRD